MKLQDYASVRSGLVLSRKQSQNSSVYKYPLINLRCIQQDGTIDLNEVDIYEAKEPLKKEYISQKGDIIVRLTAPYTAVLIDSTTSGMVISSNFVVIRVENDCLLPEYLFWLLNTQKIKRQMYENATSNMLGAVKAKFLTDFELQVLSVEDQFKIGQLNLLAQKESQLFKELVVEKTKYYDSLLAEVYKKAVGGLGK
ncbi:Type I restriction modification DNA specificity domain [[Clostridium] cf. saccharolyticum K10]|nr:Type I restriction modification DNA specificity domain [[Clostridium] cf. saccharolyticum K10]